MDESPPRNFRFGDYELLEQIGRGGMGVVYKARNLKLGVTVALKRILWADLATPLELDRLRIEAETAANCRHPNIVAIHEFGEVNGEYFFTMDLIQGTDLAQRIRQKEFAIPETRDQGTKAQVQKTQARIAKLMATAARAVHHAHQCRFLHRDLTPSNILMDASDQPIITDFGVATALSATQVAVSGSHVVGKPSYMSPEQAAGKRISFAADIYGLGAILYELLTGRPPFRGTTPLDTLRLVADQEVENPATYSEWVDRDLASICLKCLEKEPGRRYSTAQDLAEDLERWLQGKPVKARRVGPVGRTWRWVRRNPVGAALIATLLAGLTTSLILSHNLIGSQQAEIRARKAILDALIKDDFWGTPKSSVAIRHHVIDMVTENKADTTLAEGHRIYTLGILAEDQPVDDAYGYAILLKALENGLPAESRHSLHLDLKLYKRNEDAVNGLLQGEVQLVKLGGKSYLKAKKMDPGIYPLIAQHPPKEGVIFTRTSSGIHRLEDLKRKSFAFGDANSTVSTWAGYHLACAGIQATDLRIAYLDSIGEWETNSDLRTRVDRLSSHTLPMESVMNNGHDAGVCTLKLFQEANTNGALFALKIFPSDPVFWIANTNVSPLDAKAIKYALTNLQDQTIFRTVSGRITSYKAASDGDLNQLREVMAAAKTNRFAPEKGNMAEPP